MSYIPTGLSDRTILSRPYIKVLNEVDRQFRGEPIRRSTPQARARAERQWRDAKRSAQRRAELSEIDRINEAVASLSPRALKVWKRILKGKWYRPDMPSTPKAVKELIDKDLLRVGGSPMVISARYMPVFSRMYVPEYIPEAMPRG